MCERPDRAPPVTLIHADASGAADRFPPPVSGFSVVKIIDAETPLALWDTSATPHHPETTRRIPQPGPGRATYPQPLSAVSARAGSPRIALYLSSYR